jgi:hypothetical protein
MTSDIETCNLEEFSKNVHIERVKYLWKGKGDPPEQTYWSFHGSKDFGIELGKSFLRGVSGRTVRQYFRILNCLIEINYFAYLIVDR